MIAAYFILKNNIWAHYTFLLYKVKQEAPPEIPTTERAIKLTRTI
ncbi:hypothetical protein EU97_0974 [Prochlorococcus marinus str. MIT 9311]|nr:hypothetical protein EU97_0974 [Prochlorococcus marinus str. MIT 9311]